MKRKLPKPTLQQVINRSQHLTDEEIEGDFIEALKDAHATAKRYNITQEDIDTEIRAVRAEKQKE